MELVEVARIGSKRELARVGAELKESWRMRLSRAESHHPV